MAPIKKVIVCGYGLFGRAIVSELLAAGFEVTVFTRNANLHKACRRTFRSGRSTITPSNLYTMLYVKIRSGESRSECAAGTSSRQRRGYIQDYLIEREKQIEWTVVNPGASIEFVFDIPFIIDFAARDALLWGDGNGRVSIGSISLAAKAVAGVLRQPERVRNHGVHVQGTTISQREVFRIAKRFSTQPWTSESKDAQEALSEYTAALQAAGDGSSPMSPNEMIATVIKMYSAMAFGDGFFPGAYREVDNQWLGIAETITDEEIEHAIQYRIQTGLKGHAAGQGETIWEGH